MNGLETCKSGGLVMHPVLIGRVFLFVFVFVQCSFSYTTRSSLNQKRFPCRRLLDFSNYQLSHILFTFNILNMENYISFKNSEGRTCFVPVSAQIVVVDGVKQFDRHGQQILGSKIFTLVAVNGVQIIVEYAVAMRIMAEVAKKITDIQVIK